MTTRAIRRRSRARETLLRNNKGEERKRLAFRLVIIGGIGVVLLGGATRIRQNYWPNIESLKATIERQMARDLPRGSTAAEAKIFLAQYRFAERHLCDRKIESNNFVGKPKNGDT